MGEREILGRGMQTFRRRGVWILHRDVKGFAELLLTFEVGRAVAI
jgi:hypothetical protein